MRRAIQLFFLAAFTFLFFANPYSEKLPVPADLFLRFDPLLAAAHVLASWELHFNLVLALIVIISTVLAGRFFCGYVCPLGTLFDLAGRRAPTTPKKSRWLSGKYYILIFVLASSLLSLNLAYLFDPLAFLTRVYTFLLYPFTIAGANLGLDALRPLADYLNLLYLSHKHYTQPVFALNSITVLLCTGLFVLHFITHRFWCRNLCPLGALLAFFARFAVLKRRVSAACTTCMRCYRACPMGAVEQEPHKTSEAECIECATCSRVCPEDAVTFNMLPSVMLRSPQKLNLSKRSFFLSAGAGVLAVLSHRMDPVARIDTGRLIRPPGALPEGMFLDVCIRCGHCMKVCPTNTLQPCFFERGIAGIWSPRLVPRLAACDQTCRLCGTVCPTDAIRTLSLEEKKHAKLGTAFIDRNRCLVWERNQLCLICDEQCPYNAIVFKWEEGYRKPYVVSNKCNGCGLCEQACPLQGASAIQVTTQGEIRLAQGSYSEKAQELQLELQEDPGDDGFFFTDDAPDNKAGSSDVPAGFIVR